MSRPIGYYEQLITNMSTVEIQSVYRKTITVEPRESWEMSIAKAAMRSMALSELDRRGASVDGGKAVTPSPLTRKRYMTLEAA